MRGRARISLSYVFPLKMQWAIFQTHPYFEFWTVPYPCIPYTTGDRNFNTDLFRRDARSRGNTLQAALERLQLLDKEEFLGAVNFSFWIHLCCNLNPGSFCRGFLFYSMYFHFLPSCFGLVNDVCFVCFLFNVKLCANSDVQIVTTFQLT